MATKQLAVESPRAARLERAVARLRVRQLPAERLERWVLIAGAVLVPTGFIVVIIGWWGAARSPFVFDQIPYLLSGGFLGLALATAGGLLYFGYWLTRLVREGRSQAEEQRVLLTEIRDLLQESPTRGRRSSR